MLTTGRTKWANQDLFRFISHLLNQPVFVPTLTLAAIMDELFKDESWWEYEYETILQMIESMDLPLPSVHVLGQIQCISALKSGRASIDKEWHLFEKASLSITGVPVLFYDKQNVPIEYIYHALKIMNKIAKVELSDEVVHYIGCETINDDILWHPTQFIDEATVAALDRIKSVIGLNKEEIDEIRATTKSRFNDIVDKDIDKINFDETSTADMMCLRIYRSILVGKELAEVESKALSTFLSIKDGHMTFDGKQLSEKIEYDSPDKTDIEYDPEIELITTDDIPEIQTFEDGVKEALFVKMGELSEVFKQAAFKNVPIETGAPMSGGEDDSDGPSHELFSTPETADDVAESAMLDAMNRNLNKGNTNSGGSKHEVADPSIAFEL